MGGHAPESGEIIDVLQKLKDDVSADLAHSQKADEEDRKTDHAPFVAAKENEKVDTRTATIETNPQQGDFETGVDSLTGGQASSEWEERQKSRADELRSRSLLRMSSPQSMRRFLRPRDSTGGRAHSPTAMLCFFLNSDVVSSNR